LKPKSDGHNSSLILPCDCVELVSQPCSTETLRWLLIKESCYITISISNSH